MEYTEAALPGPPVRRPLWEQPTPIPEPPVVDEVPPVQEPVEDDEPEPVEYPDPPRTGDAEVDEAIEGLAQAIGGPLDDQLTAFDAAHRTLQARLADVEG